MFELYLRKQVREIDEMTNELLSWQSVRTAFTGCELEEGFSPFVIARTLAGRSKSLQVAESILCRRILLYLVGLGYNRTLSIV